MGFLDKGNLAVTFFWKPYVLKLLMNYLTGTLMISMGYVTGNFAVG